MLMETLYENLAQCQVLFRNIPASTIPTLMSNIESLIAANINVILENCKQSTIRGLDSLGTNASLSHPQTQTLAGVGQNCNPGFQQ